MIRSRLKIILAQREVAQRETFRIAELAVASGVSRQTLYNLANNATTRYDSHVLNALCQVLDIQVGEILLYIPDSSDATSVD